MLKFDGQRELIFVSVLKPREAKLDTGTMYSTILIRPVRDISSFQKTKHLDSVSLM